MWRFRGSLHYLEQQADRLGISGGLADRARHNPEIYHISVLLAQLCEQYRRSRPEQSRTDLACLYTTLAQAEEELSKLHALAGASQAMLDEAWAAVGLAAPCRYFRVTCDLDLTDPPPDPGCSGG